MNWQEFFHMGGYAFHVWTCWGLTLLVLIVLFIQPKLASAKIKREIARQISREKTAQVKNPAKPNSQSHSDQTK